MSNNAPDYGDNLVFEPEMTWEELVEWVKKSVDKDNICIHNEGGYINEEIQIEKFIFTRTGCIYFENFDYEDEIVFENRTPENMQAIIKALYQI